MYKIKKKLLNGELVLGTIISEIRNPNIAYLLAQCGFEFFIIDNEHGTYNYETISAMIAAARGANISVIVRIPEIKRESILKPLDAGAAGLLVPMVNTAAEAREVIHHAKYPPMGNRGAALRRPHNLYAIVNAPDYLQQANENTFIAVQAETTTSIENISEIAAVEGVDCIFVGPFDLSISLGVPGQINHPLEVEAIEKIAVACKKHNKIAGILMFEQEMLTRWIKKDFRFAVYSSDITMLADAASNAVKELKNVVV
ncbi:MAG: aldolase/citrate lyase family protein [Mariniphaga sp.]|jgi:2-keto-3-deoxy-L-rhamnonate aldolase RhmA|nr:aldolase/citrate lyase family protein [Mariniphaga sp.]